MTGRGGERWGRLSRFLPTVFLLAPCARSFLPFLALPTSLGLARASSAPEPTLEHVRHLVRQPVYLRVLATPLRYCVIVTGACLLFGYPLACYISGLSERRRGLVLPLVL